LRADRVARRRAVERRRGALHPDQSVAGVGFGAIQREDPARAAPVRVALALRIEARAVRAARARRRVVARERARVARALRRRSRRVRFSDAVVPIRRAVATAHRRRRLVAHDGARRASAGHVVATCALAKLVRRAVLVSDARAKRRTVGARFDRRDDDVRGRARAREEQEERTLHRRPASKKSKPIENDGRTGHGWNTTSTRAPSSIT